jgi:4-amino-4-deoxy-L-arabinose transferase-like glycosyltransferase
MKSNNSVHYVLRYVLYALALLPIFFFRDFTLDNELRYLSIADEALRNGSIFTFTNHGIIYADKPPFYIWMVMLGKLLLGNHSLLFLGLFSLVPALVVLYIMDKWVKNELKESERCIGQLMLLTNGFFISTAVVLRMDMLMCMFIVLSLYTFFKMYSSGSTKQRDTLLFPFFVFMAIFTKGPVGILVPLVSTAVFLFIKGEIKNIFHYWGWKTAIVLLIFCGAWLTGVYAEGGGQYLNDLLFNQTVNRAINSFHHKEPIYYYLTTSWYSLAPWSLLYAGILIMGVKKRFLTTDLERYFLVIALSTFVILSLFSSKLQIYLLPAFPFITYLSVLWMPRFDSQRWMLPLVGFPAAILCLVLPVSIIAKKIVNNDQFNSSIIMIAATILLFTGILSIKYLIDRKLYHGILTISAGVLLGIFTLSFAIPNYNSFIGLNNLCEKAKKTAIQKGAKNYYYCEISRGDNLDVYLGIRPEMLKIKDLYELESSIRKPSILFLSQKAIDRNDSLQVFIKNKPAHKSGNYYFIEIE